MAQPPADGICQLCLQRSPDEEVRGRAGTAVQILVTAAGRHVRIGLEEVDGHRAGRVREIPDGQRAGVVRGARQRTHVQAFAGAEVDVCQQQHTDALVERVADFGARDMVHLARGQKLRDSVSHVQVSGKVVVLGEDDGAVWPGSQRASQQLEEAHGRAVRDQDLVLGGAEEAGELGAHAVRRIHPRVIGPAAHQSARPLVRDELAHARCSAPRRAAERVAVEVEEVVVDLEPLAKRRQRVIVVEPLTERAVDHLRERSGHRSARTSQSSGKKRRSTVERR